MCLLNPPVPKKIKNFKTLTSTMCQKLEGRGGSKIFIVVLTFRCNNRKLKN